VKTSLPSFTESEPAETQSMKELAEAIVLSDEVKGDVGMPDPS